MIFSQEIGSPLGSLLNKNLCSIDFMWDHFYMCRHICVSVCVIAFSVFSAHRSRMDQRVSKLLSPSKVSEFWEIKINCSIHILIVCGEHKYVYVFVHDKTVQQRTSMEWKLMNILISSCKKAKTM